MVLFLGDPGIVAAQETVFHRFEAEHPDEELVDVLYLAAGVELTQAGLSSRRSEGDAEYTLYTEYDPRSDEVIVAYTLTDSSPPRRPIAETLTARNHRGSLSGRPPIRRRREAPRCRATADPSARAAERNPAGAAFPGAARPRARSGGGRGRRAGATGGAGWCEAVVGSGGRGRGGPGAVVEGGRRESIRLRMKPSFLLE